MAKKKAKAPGSRNGKPLPKEIKFDFIKSNFFRVIHADGVWGGVGVRGDIDLNFYSERRAIPKQVTFEVTESGQLGEEMKDKRDERGAIIREVEVSVSLDLERAMSLRDWLNRKIEELQKIIEAQKEDR